MEHIVIIGNGISGITAARHIRKLSDKKITNYTSSKELFEASVKYGDMIIDSLITMEEYSLLFR